MLMPSNAVSETPRAHSCLLSGDGLNFLLKSRFKKWHLGSELRSYKSLPGLRHREILGQN